MKIIDFFCAFVARGLGGYFEWDFSPRMAKYQVL